MTLHAKENDTSAYCSAKMMCAVKNCGTESFDIEFSGYKHKNEGPMTQAKEKDTSTQWT